MEQRIRRVSGHLRFYPGISAVGSPWTIDNRLLETFLSVNSIEREVGGLAERAIGGIAGVCEADVSISAREQEGRKAERGSDWQRYHKDIEVCIN